MAAFHKLVQEALKARSPSQLSEKEVEDKFLSLSLAFKTDTLTLSQRLDLQERQRDIAEQNIERELEGLREALKVLGTQVTDSEIRPVYQKIQQHVEVLEQSTARVSSRAEQLGAVQQEGRMSKAIEVMVQHTENLKRTYEKEHTELEETKKVLQENRIFSPGLEYGDGLSKRSMSITGGTGLKTRRRASVAALPRMLGGMGTVSKDTSHMLFEDRKVSLPAGVLVEDPKSRFQTLVANTAVKNTLAGVLRRASTTDRPQLSPSGALRSPIIRVTTTTNGVDDASKPKSDENQNNEGLKSGTQNNKSDEKKDEMDKEAIFKKGFEEGVRSTYHQELSGLREQQQMFHEKLEDLMDQNDEEEEEILSFEKSIIEKEPLMVRLKEMLPVWEKSGLRIRYTLAGLVLAMGLVSIIFTLLPVGESFQVKSSFHTFEELLQPHIRVKYNDGSPPI